MILPLIYSLTDAQERIRNKIVSVLRAYPPEMVDAVVNNHDAENDREFRQNVLMYHQAANRLDHLKKFTPAGFQSDDENSRDRVPGHAANVPSMEQAIRSFKSTEKDEGLLFSSGLVQEQSAIEVAVKSGDTVETVITRLISCDDRSLFLEWEARQTEDIFNGRRGRGSACRGPCHWPPPLFAYRNRLSHLLFPRVGFPEGGERCRGKLPGYQ